LIVARRPEKRPTGDTLAVFGGRAREILRCSATRAASPALLETRSLCAALLAGASGALSLRSAVGRRGRLRLPRLPTARAPFAWLAEQSPSLRSAATRRPFPPSPGFAGIHPLLPPPHPDAPLRRRLNNGDHHFAGLVRKAVAAPGFGMLRRCAPQHRARRRSARLVPGDPISLSVTRLARPPFR